MHVLVLPSWYSGTQKPHAGAFFKQHAHALQSLGHQVGMAYFDARSLGSFSISAARQNRFQTTDSIEDCIQTVRISGWNPGAQTAPGARIWAQICAKAANHYIAVHGKPDVIHAQSGVWGGLAAAKIKDKTGIPFILTEHSSLVLANTLGETLNELYASAAREAHSLSAVSRPLADAMTQLLPGHEISILPNCIDFEFWSMDSEAQVRSSNSFLAVGNLVKLKGFDVLLNAFKKVLLVIPDATLTIVGSGSEKSNLSELVQGLKIQSQVCFMGAVDRNQLRDEYRKVSCYVCSSRLETFGVAPLEALACGLPVISTRCGGPEEFIENPSGTLVGKDDPDAMANAMIKVAQSGKNDDGVHGQRIAKNYGRAEIGLMLERALLDAMSSSPVLVKGGRQKWQ